MARVEIKPSSVATPCVCNSGHTAKHKIVVKGMYTTPQAEMCLCDECFEELKEKITHS